MRRENNYDLLRSLSCVFIVILHAGAFYQNDGEEIGTILQALTRTAVPCFVMLSGAFLLNDERWREYTYCLNKTARTIIKPTLFYSIVFIAISMLTYKLGLSDANYLKVIRLALDGYPYPHMWYMFMCVGLYLVTPLIWKLKTSFQSMGHHAYEVLILILLLIGCVVEGTSQLFWMVKWFPFIGYFVVGNYIKNWSELHKHNWVAPVSALCWITFISASCIIQVLYPNIKYWGGIHTNPLNPIVMVASIACFVFFSNIEVPFSSYCFSNKTGRIYLIHILPMQIIKTFLEKLNGGGLPNPLLGLSVMIIGTIIVSYIYSYIAATIFSRSLKRNSMP